MTTLDLFQDLEHSSCIPAAGIAFNVEPSIFALEEEQNHGGCSSSWLETTSDLHAFMNALPDTEEDDEDVEAVIDNMEKFLQNHEKQKDSDDMIAAEALLDRLIKESPAFSNGQQIREDTMIDLTNVNKVITEDGQEILIVIDPSESSLRDHDYTIPKSIENPTQEVKPAVPETGNATTISPEDMDAAEDLLDELLKSNDFNWDILDGDQEVETVINEVEQFLQTVDHKPMDHAPVLLDHPNEEDQHPKAMDHTPILKDQTTALDQMDFSNVTKVVTDDGKEIIIMIAPPSPTTTSSTPTTSWSSPTENSSGSLNDEDPDWTPEPTAKSRVGRPRSSASSIATGRPSLTKAKRKHPYATNRKERKKQQNVEAARRYRDRKKGEQNIQETEVELLNHKNNQLKSEVEKLEAEVKTMKRIVGELGLI